MTAVRVCKFNHGQQVLVGTVLKDKGIGFQVRLDNGVEMFIPRKRILCSWEESLEQNQEAQENPAPDLPTQEEVPPVAQAEAAATTPEPKKRAKATATATTEPRNTVALKELCFDLGLEPRIARRRLRKALGNVGTGSRWEWAKNSPELAKVTAALVGTAPTEPTDNERVNSDAEDMVE